VDTAAIVLLLCLFIVQLPIAIASSYILGLLFLVFGASSAELKTKYVEIYVVVILFCLPAATTFNHGLTPLFYLIFSPSIVFLVIHFTNNSLDHVTKVLRNVFWAYIFGVATVLFLHWDEPEPFGAVFSWSSTNGIPAYLIIVNIAYTVAYFLKYNRIPIHPAAITLVVAFFGVGRGSIISASVLLVLGICINLFVVKSKQDIALAPKIALIALLPVLALIYSYADLITTQYEMFVEGSKFEEGVLDVHRGYMLSDYLDKLDALSLFIGTSYDGTSINLYYGGNPHNSFIRVHSFYGLFALLFVFAPLFLMWLSNRDRTQTTVIFLFAVVALMRATTEPILFPTPLDFFYIMYFVLFFRFARQKNETFKSSVAHTTLKIHARNPPVQ
jgi:hypothetical protein